MQNIIAIIIKTLTLGVITYDDIFNLDMQYTNLVILVISVLVWIAIIRIMTNIIDITW
jgi:hypothetical protein